MGGHTVSVVAPADRGNSGRETMGGVEVVRVRYAAASRETLAYAGDMVRQSRSPLGAWTFRRLVRSLASGAQDEVRRLDADLVHAFWWVPGGWAAIGARVPVVLSLMGTDVAMMRRWPARWLARRVLSRASYVTALSTYLAQEARRATRLPTLEIDRIPVPVDIERFRGKSSGGGGVVYLGRLTPQKRVDLLLDAVHHAAIDVPVTIIGEGPARCELERHSAALNLKQVRFRGALPDDEVISVMANADVAAFLSRSEGLGLAAAEAMMLGVPVVATLDGGGVRDLVRHGEGACVVQPTREAVGAALQHCLSDPSIRDAARYSGDVLRTQLAPGAVAAMFEQAYVRVRSDSRK